MGLPLPNHQTTLVVLPCVPCDSIGSFFVQSRIWTAVTREELSRSMRWTVSYGCVVTLGEIGRGSLLHPSAFPSVSRGLWTMEYWYPLKAKAHRWMWADAECDMPRCSLKSYSILKTFCRRDFDWTLDSKMIANTSLSICPYFCSVVVKVRDPYPIGHLLPSSILWASRPQVHTVIHHKSRIGPCSHHSAPTTLHLLGTVERLLLFGPPSPRGSLPQERI